MQGAAADAPQVWSWVVEELVVYTVSDECKPKPYRAITALGLELGGWELRVISMLVALVAVCERAFVHKCLANCNLFKVYNA